MVLPVQSNGSGAVDAIQSRLATPMAAACRWSRNTVTSRWFSTDRRAIPAHPSDDRRRWLRIAWRSC